MERAVIRVCQQWLCRRTQERSAEVTLSILSADSTKKITQEKTFIVLNMLKEKLFFGVNTSSFYALQSFVKDLSGQKKPLNCRQIDIRDTNAVE